MESLSAGVPLGSAKAALADEAAVTAADATSLALPVSALADAS